MWYSRHPNRHCYRWPGVQCDATKIASDGWTLIESQTLLDADTSAKCLTVGYTIAEDPGNTGNDLCLQFKSTGDSSVGANDASFVCQPWYKASGGEVRKVIADAAGPPTVAYEAWFWDDRVKTGDFIGSEATSAQSITSAIATIVTIAAFASWKIELVKKLKVLCLYRPNSYSYDSSLKFTLYLLFESYFILHSYLLFKHHTMVCTHIVSK